jgi:hypothetical protein
VEDQYLLCLSPSVRRRRRLCCRLLDLLRAPTSAEAGDPSSQALVAERSQQRPAERLVES